MYAVCLGLFGSHKKAYGRGQAFGAAGHMPLGIPAILIKVQS